MINDMPRLQTIIKTKQKELIRRLAFEKRCSESAIVRELIDFGLTNWGEIEKLKSKENENE
jgi:hypothetical protein